MIAVSPITLLQGPPGTGKTRTILGIAAVLLGGALDPLRVGTRIRVGASLTGFDYSGRSVGGGGGGGALSGGGSVSSSSSASGSSVGGGGGSANPNGSNAAKTRLLMCAPSNTATDELVYRLVTQVRL
jgi:hypothetical protein